MDKIEAEILELALKYDFVTPLTAMVVTKPEVDSTATPTLAADDDDDDDDFDTFDASYDYGNSMIDVMSKSDLSYKGSYNAAIFRSPSLRHFALCFILAFFGF